MGYFLLAIGHGALAGACSFAAVREESVGWRIGLGLFAGASMSCALYSLAKCIISLLP